MLNKIKNINSIDTFYGMLDSISQSMETNMTTENILSFYNIAKDILTKNTNETSDLSSLIGFERMYLSGYDQMIVDYDGINNTGSGLQLYNFVPYQGSIQDISDAMKVNLELKEQEIIKTYNFDINEPYEKEAIGEGYYSDYSVSLLPSFVGRDISYAQNYCNARGIRVTVNKVPTTMKSMDGEITTQSLPSGMDAQYAGSITFSVAEYTSSNSNTNNNSTYNENTNNSNTNNNNTNTNTTENTDDDEIIPGIPSNTTEKETTIEKEEVSANITTNTKKEENTTTKETTTETTVKTEKEKD